MHLPCRSVKGQHSMFNLLLTPSTRHTQSIPNRPPILQGKIDKFGYYNIGLQVDEDMGFAPTDQNRFTTYDYEGGNFEFDGDIDQLPPEHKEKGTVIVFPSFYRHRVTPVTKGTRKVLVAWFEGPHWR